MMTTTFFHLPCEDVISLIFPHLDALETWRLRQVCREFCRLCDQYFATFCSSVAYKERASQETEISRDRACITRALHACRKLRNVSVCLSRRSPSSALLKRACGSLMTTLWRLGEDSQLVSLSLVAVNYNSADPNSDWERLGERCGDLRELHIEDVSPFDDLCLEHLTRQSTSLAKLTLISLPNMRGLCLHKLAGTSTQLTTLNLSGCCNIEAEQLWRMFRCCHNVRNLDLSSLFAAVEDQTILVVKEFCPHLQWLCVSQCSRVTQRYLLPLKERGVEVIGNDERSCHNYRKIWGQI